MTLNSEGKRKEFMLRLPRAASLEPLTWCPKHKKCLCTVQLWALHCWDCSMYVVNGGGCDPL